MEGRRGRLGAGGLSAAMTPRRRASKLLVVVVVGAAAIGLAPPGCRVARYALAATRSTSQFRVSPLDPRVEYEPGAEAQANVVAAALPSAVETVARGQYGPFDAPIHVYVCATIDTFVKYGASPRAAGFTLQHRVFLSPKPENTAERLPRIVAHELSHLHLDQNRPLWTLARLPVWFVEGLAVEVSGGGGAEGVPDAELRQAIAEGRTFVPQTTGSPFRSMGAGAYGLDEHMFYGQAGLFVGFLRSLDEARFGAFLHGVEGGAALGPAFERAYGFSIDAAWSRFVDRVKTGAAAGLPAGG
jgi:hypothetical protein